MSSPVLMSPKVRAVIEEIRVGMARKAWRQADLARTIGENETWISRRLAARVPITVDDLFRIADALEVDPRLLLPGSSGAVTVRPPAILHPATFPADRLRVVGHRRATRLSQPIMCAA